MNLRDLLNPTHIVLPLAAVTVQDATEQLVQRLVTSGAVTDPRRLDAVIRNTWPEDMVSVGEHAFLPHFRTEAVGRLVTAVGVSPRPIRWEKDPNRSARIVILVVAPPREAATYLQVVGAFARTLADPETVLALLAAKTPEQVLAIPRLAEVDLPGQLTVRDVMTPQVLSVKADEPLGDAARFMLEHDIRALPVVDEHGQLLGMLTHKELLRHLIPEYLQRAKSGEVRGPTKMQLQRPRTDPRNIPVREAMARTVLCLAEEQALVDVANLMNSKDVDRFPVVREGVVVGFLTRADLIRRLISL